MEELRELSNNFIQASLSVQGRTFGFEMHITRNRVANCSTATFCVKLYMLLDVLAIFFKGRNIRHVALLGVKLF
jgi:hypothetical protein